MLDAIPTLDQRDVFYIAIGLALLGLTLQPALARWRLLNVPLIPASVRGDSPGVPVS